MSNPQTTTYNPAFVRKIKQAIKAKPAWSGTAKEFLKWLNAKHK